jgi:hypothetical protein
MPRRSVHDRRAGREAVAVRKGLLVVLMVAASFAGGSVINGPGLSWARGRFHDYLTEVFGSPGIQSSSDAVANEQDDEETETVAPAPLPNFDLAALTERREASKPREKDKDKEAGEAPSSSSPAPASSAVPQPLPPLSLSSAEPTQARNAPKVDPALTRASAPAPAPAADGPSAPIGRSEDPWAGIRKRLQDLKVRQYWVEGQPEGPVRFRCVVPVIGNGANAVSQYFEAEGPDEVRAAEAVLRRITIWRATEGP